MTRGLSRRRFMQTGAATAALVGGGTLGAGGALSPLRSAAGPADRELRAPIAVVGGGFGGCAAALALLRSGISVILTEETDWLGGQMTSQAVPPDENPWIESIANPSYAELRRRVREYYKRNFPLNHRALRDPHLNPGQGNVSALCCEPRVAVAVIEEMLAPYRGNGMLRILLNHVPIAAETEGDRILAVRFEDREHGGERIVWAEGFLDATETGELLHLAQVEHVTGAEARSETGEDHAPEKADPDNIQAITWCFPVEYRHGEDHTINRPDQYDFWREYVPQTTPPWSGKLLSRTDIHPVTLGHRTRPLDPVLEGRNEVSGFWRYRRIRYAGHYEEGFPGGDVSLINWPMNDYFEGNVFNVSPEERTKNLEAAKQLSLSLLYWLQTEAPHDDGKGAGWRGLRLCPEVTGTEDGLAKAPYIRESRRIRAKFTVTEAHMGTEMRMAATGKSREEVAAETFADSVGVGSYRIDLHPSTGLDNYIDISSLPFQIPLGALIPVRMINLLPACKNIGSTHITNGCCRLHPVEWNIGEAAGHLAAFCLELGKNPHQVYESDTIRADYLGRLRAEKIPLEWPRMRPR